MALFYFDNEVGKKKHVFLIWNKFEYCRLQRGCLSAAVSAFGRHEVCRNIHDLKINSESEHITVSTSW
jgi:hypothetical protein